MRNDVAASILIQALYLIGGFLSCTIHVAHLPRMSSELGTLADHLSRVKTSGEGDMAAVSHVTPGTPHRVLLPWLEDPQEDWELANRLLASKGQRSCPSFETLYPFFWAFSQYPKKENKEQSRFCLFWHYKTCSKHTLRRQVKAAGW